MNQDQQLQRALAIVEKYGMKGDVIYREIAALSAKETEPQKCDECHGTGRVEENHKVDNSGRTVAAFGCCDSCGGTGEALTATQQEDRKPLTDEQIIQVMCDCPVRTNDWADHIDFARAIEAAHNIKEQQ